MVPVVTSAAADPLRFAGRWREEGVSEKKGSGAVLKHISALATVAADPPRGPLNLVVRRFVGGDNTVRSLQEFLLITR